MASLTAKQRKLLKTLKIGDKVTCRWPVEAYYSGYAGLPQMHFTPEMTGVVGAIDMPAVRYGSFPSDTFLCVDFHVPDENAAHPSHQDWRAALGYDNVVPLEGEKEG